MRGQIKLLEYNLGDLTDKLKEANKNIYELNRNLEIKEQINIKKINDLNKIIKNKENIILRLIPRIENMILRDKNIKKILSNESDNYDINFEKNETEQLWNSLEKIYNI